MGMHFGLIAARAPVAELRAAFSELWPQLEVVETAQGFPDAEAIWSWRSAHERFVSAAEWSRENPGIDVYVFGQDGPWALLVDSTYVLPADEDALRKLSRTFGTVLSFLVESTGGSAGFWCYESGALRRMIFYADGDAAFSGAPLPQERGIDVSHYFESETDQLMRAFGLSDGGPVPDPATAVAISTIDRTYHGGRDAAAAASASKPWWKFW